MLYDRDYRFLTPEETAQLDKAEAFLAKNRKKGWSVNDLFKYHEMHPIAGYFYKSLFPNNRLYIDELKNTDLLKSGMNEFINLLDQEGVSEQDVLRFIKENKLFSMIGSISRNFDFGHHGMYLFKEFKLATNYVCDYLVIGKNSHGYHFAFVEIENPNGEITTKNGEFGSTIRKGLKQIEDWDQWIDANFHVIRLEFEKYIKPNDTLPKEFLSLDKSRINYVVIAGRRSDFSEKTYTLKRKLERQRQIKLLHFDNLTDSFEETIKIGNY